MQVKEVKEVKIGIRNLDDVLDNFVAAGEAIERGEAVKRESTGVYFTDLDAFRKALTKKRFELIQSQEFTRETQPTDQSPPRALSAESARD